EGIQEDDFLRRGKIILKETRETKERRQQRRRSAVTPPPQDEIDHEDEENQSPSPRRTLNIYLIEAAIANRDAARLCCDVAAAIKRLQEL
ncbi:unnamed protein product, partial [Didymodactylos carnosus]